MVKPRRTSLESETEMIANRCIRVVLVLVAALASGAGCRTARDAEVRVAREADVVKQIDTLAADIADVLGGKLIRPQSNTSACENDLGDTSGEVRSVLGGYQIRVKDSRDRANFTKVSDHWRALGWTVTEDRYIQKAHSGTVTLETADKSLDFSLVSTDTSTLLGLIVTSDCFREGPGPNSP